MSTFIQISVCKDVTDKGIMIPQSTGVCVTAITDVRVWKRKPEDENKGDGIYIPEGSSRIFGIDASDWEKLSLIIQGTANIGFTSGKLDYDFSSFPDRIFDVTFDETFN
ncbi:MAG: hypothetical protein LBO74_16845 [Candidatus Symbiothrix sp.]|jgi:hypothetical protein|nr:hypothetical protein [Candidatus Symbiothrix sp.]